MLINIGKNIKLRLKCSRFECVQITRTQNQLFSSFKNCINKIKEGKLGQQIINCEIHIFYKHFVKGSLCRHAF